MWRIGPIFTQIIIINNKINKILFTFGTLHFFFLTKMRKFTPKFSPPKKKKKKKEKKRKENPPLFIT
jgi:hypothetical protein